MQPFEYVAPRTLEEVLDLLADAPEDTLLLAGGTSAVLMMKQDLLAPARVVALGRVEELKGLEARPDGSLRLRAGLTLAELGQAPAVASAYPVVARTARLIGNVRVRSVATLGGHLAHGDPAQDLPPVLMALGARVKAVSRRGTRWIPLEELYRDYMTTALEPDEVLTEVELPPPPPGLKAAYVKFTPRSRDDYATVGVACALVVEDGICRRAAIALGGVGPTPLRIRAAEAVLEGQVPTPERIAEAARLAEEGVEPWDDLRGSAAYKRAMSRVWTARVLTELVWEAGVGTAA